MPFRHLFIAAVSTFTFSHFAMAVEPVPTPGKKDTTTTAPTEGAIKVEKTPAVPPEALELKKTTPAQTAPEKSEESSEHYFGLHGALGFPHPVSAGLNYVHSSKLFSAELSAGAYNATISDVKVGISNTEIALRYHPFAGSFYVGALAGNQKITAEKTEVISAVSVDAKVEVKSNYITPHLGWMWGMSDGGFFASMELGYQSPSSVKTDFTNNAPTAVQSTQEYLDLEKEVKDECDKFGKIGLPHVVLLKLGWLF